MELTAAARRLRAAVGFLQLPRTEPGLRLLHRCLDTWNGIGLVVVGMARRGYRLHLTNIDEGVWRATFSRAAGLAQDGFGVAPTPWRAVQATAREALRRCRERAVSWMILRGITGSPGVQLPDKRCLPSAKS